MTADRATVLLAHGLGGSTDLAVPYAYAMVGAAWALTFTFALVAFAWRRPRFDPDKPGHPLPAAMTTLIDARATRCTVAAVALAFAVWVVYPGFHRFAAHGQPGKLSSVTLSIICRRCPCARASSRCWRCCSGGVPATLSSSILLTIRLLVFVSVVALTFSLAAQATAGVDRTQRRTLPGQMAHSLIPIVVGYIFAHYLSYLVERGQQAVIALADPFGRGWNLAGLAHMHVAYVLSAHPRCWPASRWDAR